jgi:hypothetical protein
VNVYWRCRHTALLVVNMGTSWKLSSAFKPRPLYPIEWKTEWVSEPILIFWRREKCLPGFKPRIVQPVVYSVHQPHCPSCCVERNPEQYNCPVCRAVQDTLKERFPGSCVGKGWDPFCAENRPIQGVDICLLHVSEYCPRIPCCFFLFFWSGHVLHLVVACADTPLGPSA